MADSSCKTYTGQSLLRISIDFGAAFSAVAYHRLVKNQQVEAPQSIQTFPGAPNAADAKVPTVILYRGSDAIAFGFEAENHLHAEDVGYTLVRHLKLALHPDYMVKDAIHAAVDPTDDLAIVKHGELFDKLVLPKGVQTQQVVTEYLRWLCVHTRDCFIRHHENGEALWKMMIGSAEFILGAPNGWSPQQRETLKQCLLATNFCHAAEKITVISEAEASLHHILNLRAKPLSLQNDNIFLVCDAGGSTIDTTAYKCVNAEKVMVEEVGPPDCLQRGGIYLSRHLRKSVEAAFAELPEYFEYNTPENIDSAMRNFERDVKNQYSVGSDDRRYLSFTHSKTPTSQRKFFIFNGKIGIDGTAFKTAYEYSTGAMIQRLALKIEEAKKHGPVKCIILVGGLGDSPYVHKRLEQEFGKMNVGVIHAPYDMPGAKAVSIGASWYALNSQAVVRRAAAFHYGYAICEDFDRSDSHHAGRYTHLHAAGDLVVANRFGVAIEKGTLSTPGEFQWHSIVQGDKAPLSHIGTRLFDSTAESLPYWTSSSHICGSEDYNEDILELGRVEYKGPGIPSKRKRGSSGAYYETQYQLGVSFGGAEIVCQMRDASTKTLIGPRFTFSAVPA